MTAALPKAVADISLRFRKASTSVRNCSAWVMIDPYNRTIPITQEEKAYSPTNREFPTSLLMDAVRKLILEKADEKRSNLAALSKAVGRNHAYLQQFIHRGVPAHLPEEVREALALALDVSEDLLRGKKKRGRSEAAVNHTSLPPNAAIATIDRQHHANGDTTEVIPGSLLVGKPDLPVFGTAQGGSGALILSDQPVDWVVRPDPLLRVKDGYGMIVTGDSMAPVHKSGSTALVNPHLPPRAGDTCVFRAHKDDGTVLAIIKELRRFTDDIWYVRQYDPRKDFPLKRTEWQICHVTVGNYFGR